MKKLIINTIITYTIIAAAYPLAAQCSGCQPVVAADQHEHNQQGSHEHQDASKSTHHHGANLTMEQFNQVLDPYLAIQKALAADDLEATRTAGLSMSKAATGHTALLKEATGLIAEAKDLKTARDAFLPISEIMIASAKALHLSDGSSLYLAHCPMAFNNKGASWLQNEPVLANPYWGAMMLRCGTIKPLSGK